MPRVITWKRTLVGGNSAANPTFVFSKVFKAFERIQTYKDVVFEQRSGGATLMEMGYKLNCSGLSIYRRMLHMFEKQEVSPVEE